MCTKTQLKKYLNQLYQIPYIDTKISVAACRLGWKWFTIYQAGPMMSKVIISYSYARNIMNSFEIYSKHQVRETASTKWKK